MYIHNSFLYSMSFEKELICSLMSNSDMYDIKLIYHQAAKNKIEDNSEDFSNLSTPCPPHKTTFKNPANAKATSFNCEPDRKKKTQEVEKAFITCKDQFIPVKKTEIKKDCNNSFSFRSPKRIPKEMQEPII